MGSAAHTNRLRRWRLENGLTVADVAELTGFTQPYLTRLERGDRGASPATKVRIARGLGVSLRDLFPNGADR
jgi:transcriptional regulator with XRE-family HTH domain